jgi:hypothetical protein
MVDVLTLIYLTTIKLTSYFLAQISINPEFPLRSFLDIVDYKNTTCSSVPLIYELLGLENLIALVWRRTTSLVPVLVELKSTENSSLYQTLYRVSQSNYVVYVLIKNRILGLTWHVLACLTPGTCQLHIFKTLSGWAGHMGLCNTGGKICGHLQNRIQLHVHVHKFIQRHSVYYQRHCFLTGRVEIQRFLIVFVKPQYRSC